MRVKTSVSKNACSYYIIKDVSTPKGGRTTVIVEKLGTHEELLEKLGGGDPMTYAKKRAQELTKLEKESKVDVSLEFSSYKKIPFQKRYVYNASYLFLQKIYHEIGLHRITSKISKNYSFKYDLDSILSRLIYTRILEPSSKKSSLEASKKLIEQPNFELHQMYRALEVLCKEKEMIQAEVYKNSLKSVKRNTNILYYDCTNFFFEISEEDDFRKYGVSKENRPNPIVQFGMFLDGSGIPLAFDIAPGNTSEQKMLRPLEQQILKDFEVSKFIVCTDAGLSSADNKAFNDKAGRGYIITQPLKKLKGHLKEWALANIGWHLSGSKKQFDISKVSDEEHGESIFYKERWIKENGIEERLIVTYSPKYRIYQEKLRERQITRAIRKMGSGHADRKRNTDPARFIKTLHCTENGEVADRSVLSLDEDKILSEMDYDGLYAVCTNLEGDVSDILKVTKRRWEIEESFCIMKSELNARPVYLSAKERITAHFLTCFLSLLIFRILEKKLEEKYTCCEIFDTMRDMNVKEENTGDYTPAFTRTELTDALFDLFGFDLSMEVTTNQKMKEILKESKRR